MFAYGKAQVISVFNSQSSRFTYMLQYARRKPRRAQSTQPTVEQACARQSMFQEVSHLMAQRLLLNIL